MRNCTLYLSLCLVLLAWSTGCQETPKRACSIDTRLLGREKVFAIDKTKVEEQKRLVSVYVIKTKAAEDVYPKAMFQFYDDEGIRIDVLSNADKSFADEGAGYKGKITCPMPGKTARVEVVVVPKKILAEKDFSEVQKGMTVDEVYTVLGWPDDEDRGIFYYITRKFGTVRILFDEDGRVASVDKGFLETGGE